MKRFPIGALAALSLVAACSSTKSSTSTATAGATSSTVASPGSNAASPASTTATSGATTTAAKASNLPACPVDALAKANGTVNITFWHAMTNENEKVLQALTDTYNGKQAKVKVTLVNQTGYEANIDAYRTASKADRPAVVQMPEYVLQQITDSKAIIPVQSCIDAEKYVMTDYVERDVAFYTVSGALQTMPFNVSDPVLFYNKAMFTKAGLDPNKPPATVQELHDAASKLVSTGTAKFGIAFDSGFDGGGGWFIEQWRAKAGQLTIDNDNGRTARATKVTFNDQPTADLMTQLQSMVKDGSAINVGSADHFENLLKMADQQEPAGMTIASSGALSSVLSVIAGGGVKGLTPTDLGIAPMPGPSGDGGVLPGGASLWLTKDKSAEEIAAAWDFTKYLTSPEAQATWAAGSGYLPVRKSAVDQAELKDRYTSQPIYKVGYDSLLAGAVNAATTGPVSGPQRQIRQAMAKAVQSVFDGADVKTALSTAESESNALLADYAKRTGG